MAKVEIDMAAFERMSDRATEGGLREVLGEYERLLKDDYLNRPGTGKQYGKHRASAPGESPAPDTGALRANTNADPTIREDGDDRVGRVVANSAQAAALHHGTERTAARPFMDRPAKEQPGRLEAAFVRGAKA